MKTAIVYESTHHQNTLKLVQAIREKFPVDTIDVTETESADLTGYDLIGFAAFGLCTSLTVKPLILRYVIAYIPSQLLAFAYVWFTGLREPLAKSAYQDIWINFTGLFVVLSLVSAAASFWKNKKRRQQ
jgi:hypothetical protein